MADYSKHSVVIDLQEKAQAADQDMRDLVREQRDFLHVKDGMWEPDVWRQRDKHPRYTIDKTTPLIEETTGRIKKADFGIKVQPVDSSASEDAADMIAGLIRNSSNLSNADHIFNQAVTHVVESGLDGWEVVQEFADTKSFHQDLLFKPINNWVDRVWFDHSSLSRTPIDARHAFKLTSFALDDYNERWPDGSGTSLSQDKNHNALQTNRDNVIVGQVYYLKDTEMDLVLMSNDNVYEDNEDFKKIADELRDLEGVTEVDRRTTTTKVQWIRQYDGGGWLKEAEETVFEFISLCPEYGKFAVIDDVITYRGMTLKQMDPQRIYNYARSRQIEEGALAPREKLMATKEQIGGYITEWENMNTSADAVLPYNFVNGQPPPFKIAGSQVNPGLETTALSMTQDMREVANKFNAAMGDGINARAGVIVDELKESSDTGDIDWTEGHEIALCYTFKVWLSGMRKVYSGTRTVRSINEAGVPSMEEINTTRTDRDTGEVVTINDLSAGIYDVVCSAGKSYKSRQGETLAGILEIAAIDPTILAEGRDIVIAASDGPGMADIAARARARMMAEGSIPQDQWTDEEMEQAIAAQQAAQNQPPQEDPLMVAARAEETKGQAELMTAQNKQIEIQGSQQVAMGKLALENKKIDLATQEFQRAGEDKFNVEAAKIDQGQQALDLKAGDQQLKAIAQSQALQAQQMNDMFNNMKTISEVMQNFVGPHIVEAGINQAVAITDAQDDQGISTDIAEEVAGTDV